MAYVHRTNEELMEAFERLVNEAPELADSVAADEGILGVFSATTMKICVEALKDKDINGPEVTNALNGFRDIAKENDEDILDWPIFKT